MFRERQKHPSNVLLFTGFEPTAIPDAQPEAYGSLEASGHYDMFEDDLRLVKEELGVSVVRMPVPWYRIEKQEGQYDWEWMDRYIARCEELGIECIADICHHSSAPIWTDFSKENFVPAHNRFCREFALRYGGVIKKYTLDNEPTATAALCVDIWYPRCQDVYTMFKHKAQAICSSTAIVKEIVPDAQFIHTDPAVHKQTLDSSRAQEVYDFNTHVRFDFFDMILGQITSEHPRYQWFLDNGFSKDELTWFVQNPAQIDVMALDYYLHCEEVVGEIPDGKKAPSARGLKELTMDFVLRYIEKFPEMKFAIGEVNIRGSVFERLSWFKYCAEESEELQKLLGEKFVGLCYYPAIDSRGWGNGSLMTEIKNTPEDIDPTGIIRAEYETNERILSVFSYVFCRYATGQITSKEIVPYIFHPEMHNYPGERLAYAMKDWQFIEQPT